ncbi:hypothetical protein ACFL39_00020 [Gemmatimonadota bacterium]
MTVYHVTHSLEKKTNNPFSFLLENAIIQILFLCVVIIEGGRTMEDPKPRLGPEELAEICRKVKEFMSDWLDDFCQETEEPPGVNRINKGFPETTVVSVIDIFYN